MLNLKRDFPDLDLYFLEQNYRSTKQILKVARNLISYNLNRLHKPQWTDRPEGIPPSISNLKNTEEEAHFIASHINEAVSSGIRYSDIGVLYRINALSQELESALSDKNIPYKIIGGVGFFQRYEIQNILSFFKLVDTPGDSASLDRASYVMSQLGIGSLSQEKFLNNLLEQIRKQNRLQDIYELIMQQTEYLNYLNRDKSSEGERRLKNIEKLETIITRFDDKKKNLKEFLDYIDNTHAEADAIDSVKLLTFHSAKGLEFDTVFIAGVMEGMVSYYKAVLPEEFEEERRAFYVAITRASNKLFITYPRLNGRIKVAPSPFISEIKKPKIDSGKVLGNNIRHGSIIEHQKWGRGRVISVYTNHKNEEEIKVRFDTSGLKTLLLKYAPIKIIELK